MAPQAVFVSASRIQAVRKKTPRHARPSRGGRADPRTRARVSRRVGACEGPLEPAALMSHGCLTAVPLLAHFWLTSRARSSQLRGPVPEAGSRPRSSRRPLLSTRRANKEAKLPLARSASQVRTKIRGQRDANWLNTRRLPLHSGVAHVNEAVEAVLARSGSTRRHRNEPAPCKAIGSLRFGE